MSKRIHRPPDVVCEALAGLTRGESLRGISQRLDVPYETVRSWRRSPPVAAQRLAAGFSLCPRCLGEHDAATLDAAAYAYLLGVYLGDGHISQHLATPILRVTLDAAHPRIVKEVAEVIATVRGRSANVNRSVKAG